MALIFSGEGETWRTGDSPAVEVLEQSDELRDDPRLLAWAAMGPLWLREATSGGRWRTARLRWHAVHPPWVCCLSC